VIADDVGRRVPWCGATAFGGDLWVFQQGKSMNSNDSGPCAARCTLHDALQRMDQTARGILLVLGDGRLARTPIDGDLRRRGCSSWAMS
jgi:hypothetical protein